MNNCPWIIIIGDDFILRRRQVSDDRRTLQVSDSGLDHGPRNPRSGPTGTVGSAVCKHYLPLLSVPVPHAGLAGQVQIRSELFNGIVLTLISEWESCYLQLLTTLWFL